MWLGASDTQSVGTYVWESSNIPISFTKWDPSQPNGVNSEHCLIAWNTDMWHDYLCGIPSVATLCESLFTCH